MDLEMKAFPVFKPTATPSITAQEGKDSTPAKSFSSILAGAMNDAVQSDVADHDGNLEILAGTDYDLHTTMIQATEAELTLNLAIQIRNKAMDAYNEIMRMSL